MSYADGYPRRPQYSNVGYGQNYRQHNGRDHEQTYGRDYGQDYGQNYGASYDPNHHNSNYQQQPYAPRRRQTSFNNPVSQVIYSNGTPRYVTGGRDYYRSHRDYSRHAPNVVVASSRNLGHQVTPLVSTSTSARYRAEGQRGEPIPVVAGVSHNEWIPFSTRIRRLFGLGPPRSSMHIGKSVHLKRWGFWHHGYHTTRQYTAANYRGRGSQGTVYTL